MMIDQCYDLFLMSFQFAGQWYCVGCLSHNIGHCTECYRCGEQRPVFSRAIPVFQPGTFVADGDLDNMDMLFHTAPVWRTAAKKQAIESLPKVNLTSEKLSSDPKCPICLEEFDSKGTATELPCKHCFHTECIEEWLNTQHTCPMCRNPIEPCSEATAHISEPTTHFPIIDPEAPIDPHRLQLLLTPVLMP